jgi:hypothetical protein
VIDGDGDEDAVMSNLDESETDDDLNTGFDIFQEMYMMTLHTAVRICRYLL